MNLSLIMSISHYDLISQIKLFINRFLFFDIEQYKEKTSNNKSNYNFSRKKSLTDHHLTGFYSTRSKIIANLATGNYSYLDVILPHKSYSSACSIITLTISPGLTSNSPFI